MSWILDRIRQRWVNDLKRESPPTTGIICELIGCSGDILKATSATSAEHYRNISPFHLSIGCPEVWLNRMCPGSSQVKAVHLCSSPIFTRRIFLLPRSAVLIRSLLASTPSRPSRLLDGRANVRFPCSDLPDLIPLTRCLRFQRVIGRARDRHHRIRLGGQ